MNKRITFLALAFIAASINSSYSFSKTDFMSNFVSEHFFGSEIADYIIIVVDADPMGEHACFVKCISLKELDGLMKKLSSKKISPEEKKKILSYSFVPMKISNSCGVVHIEQMTVGDEDDREGLFFRLEEATRHGLLGIKHHIKFAWHSGWVLWHLGEMALSYAKQAANRIF